MGLPKSGLLNGLLGKIGNGQPVLVSVLDPGSEYVKALVIELDGERAVILGQGIERHEEKPFDRGIRAVDLRLHKACDLALRQAEDMTASVAGLGQKLVPDHLVLSCPPHWVRQGAFTVEQRRASPGQEITDKELEGALVRAQRLALQQLAEQLGVTKNDLTAIGFAVTESKVGGHPVSDPVGFHGDTLSLTVFNAVAQNRHLAVLERLAEHLELELIHLVSEEHVVADCLPTEDALLVNTGSDLTSLGWMRAGCPLQMTTLPFGGRNLSEHLASAFDLAPAKAEALKLRYSLGRLEVEDAEAVRQVLVPAIVEWLARVEAGLAVLAGKRMLPPFIYFCGGGSELPDLLEAAHGFPWLQHLKFSRYPEMHVFGPGQVPGVFNRTSHAGGREMTVAMALARWAIPRKNIGERMGGILDRVTRKQVDVYSGG
jgi:hypothetical protein